MGEKLISVGLDVGTTTTQLILSELEIENRASSFSVPDMQIIDRKIIFKSPVHFTPLLSEMKVDGAGISRLVEQAYRDAGISKEQVDTGAAIITGETSRKENAQTVLNEVAAFAGEFVVATAGPDLESVLAAKGAGATAFSEKETKPVLHMDIGGGTSNLALLQDGQVVKTGCMNVGGRLLKLDGAGKIIYRSPVLQGLTHLREGDTPTAQELEGVAEMLARALEMAAGITPRDSLFDALVTREAELWNPPIEEVVLSFSGGVADCIEEDLPPLAYGDLGVYLGRAIRKSRLCQGKFMLGKHTIRATVIGAGCHSTQLSGSTVFYRGVHLPAQNLPVVALDESKQEDAAFIAAQLSRQDKENVVLAMPGYPGASFSQVENLARVIAKATAGKPVWVCTQADMAKALGYCLCSLLQKDTPILCIDRLRLSRDSFLDVGQAVGPALPVVIKTLIFSEG